MHTHTYRTEYQNHKIHSNRTCSIPKYFHEYVNNSLSLSLSLSLVKLSFSLARSSSIILTLQSRRTPRRRPTNTLQAGSAYTSARLPLASKRGITHLKARERDGIPAAFARSIASIYMHRVRAIIVIIVIYARDRWNSRPSARTGDTHKHNTITELCN